MNELLREFFYDGICRIIPGLVVIGLYGRQFLVEGFKALRDIASDHSLVVLVPCVLLAAWLIGVMVDIATFVILFLLWLFFGILIRCFKVFEKSTPVALNCARLRKGWFVDDCQLITKPGADIECRQRMKQLAEKSFFRIMALVSLFTLLCHPPEFRAYQWNNCYGIFGFCVFLGGWCWTFHWLKEWRKRTTKPK